MGSDQVPGHVVAIRLSVEEAFKLPPERSCRRMRGHVDGAIRVVCRQVDIINPLPDEHGTGPIAHGDSSGLRICHLPVRGGLEVFGTSTTIGSHEVRELLRLQELWDRSSWLLGSLSLDLTNCSACCLVCSSDGWVGGCTLNWSLWSLDGLLSRLLSLLLSLTLLSHVRVAEEMKQKSLL